MLAKLHITLWCTNIMDSFYRFDTTSIFFILITTESMANILYQENAFMLQSVRRRSFYCSYFIIYCCSHCLWGFCVSYLFCYAVLSFLSSFAVISIWKGELIYLRFKKLFLLMYGDCSCSVALSLTHLSK